MLHVSVNEDEWKQLCTLIQEINVQINKKKKNFTIEKILHESNTMEQLTTRLNTATTAGNLCCNLAICALMSATSSTT